MRKFSLATTSKRSMKQEQHNKYKAEQLLDSLHRIRSVEPSPYLWAKIQHKIETRRKEVLLISGKLVWQAVLAFVMLLMLNITALYIYSSETATEFTILAEEFGLLNNSYDNF